MPYKDKEYGLLRARRVRKERKLAGLCYSCDSLAVVGRTYCSNHLIDNRSRFNNRVRTWKDSGVCGQCGNPVLIDNKKMCYECYFINISKENLGTMKLAKRIKELLEIQNWKCALTGDTLDMSNLQLDHIIPRSRGGKDVINNVRWVTRRANMIKRDMMDDEMVIMCNKIIKHLIK